MPGKRFLAALALLGVMVVLGASVAHAGWGWWWNSAILIDQEVEMRTQWTVDDGATEEGLYSAQIEVRVPPGTDAQVVEVAANETVVIKESNSVQCKPDGIEVAVKYKVSTAGAYDNDILVGFNIIANGQSLDSGTAHLNESKRLRAFIALDNPKCLNSQ